jgi:hypothetical protein
MGNSGGVADPISIGFNCNRNPIVICSVQFSPGRQQMTLVTAPRVASLMRRKGSPNVLFLKGLSINPWASRLKIAVW